MSTRTRFEKEAKGNSEMAYLQQNCAVSAKNLSCLNGDHYQYSFVSTLISLFNLAAKDIIQEYLHQSEANRSN